MKEVFQKISEHIFPQERINTFAVLDGASIPDLLDCLYDLRPEFVCLFRGELEPDMAEVAPYLVRLAPQSEFARRVIEKGWGNHWGLFAVSRADLRQMRRHLQKLLVVYDTEGRPLHFRYYDPRVMRVYLPTCNAEELETVFGPIACFVMEDEKRGSALSFRNVSGSLQREKLKIADD
jgi:hypothetical protein